MAFARLAPHCGLTPVYGHSVGVCDMRGGFSWSSLGNSISSGLKTFGSFLGNTAQKIGNSAAFQQAKQGLLNSGVIENAGNLAGQTISSLVDIGRLKAELDLQRLRDRVIAQSTPSPPVVTTVEPASSSVLDNLSQEQIAQLLAARSPQVQPAVPAVPGPSGAVSLPTPLPATPIPAAEVITPVIPSTVAPSVDIVEEVPIRKPPRKRKRVSGWGTLLTNMTGDGVRSSTTRYCY